MNVLLIAWSCGITSALIAAFSDDILVADFEADSYHPWQSTGQAFGPGPARGTLPGQMQVDGFKGSGLVNSFYQGDATTGTLTSPPFTLERRFVTFLIGGGKDAINTAMHLLIDGQIVRTATGPNDQPGGVERLSPGSWEISEFMGQTAVVRIVDHATGGWGHINVDHIVQTDRQPPGILTNATRSFTIERRYLHLPIKNGAPKRVVTTLVDDQVEVRNDIELADAEPDWWSFMDVGRWHGRTVTLQVDTLPEVSSALSSIEQSNSIRGSDPLYREPLRGQFHFSSRRGWNNDPNGMVYFNGEYHLFYQHNPYGWSWGNMHWGHAVSPDMVHWQELGDKLSPDDMGPMFSGSAVVDWNNTSRLGQNGKPPLVLVYTAAGNPAVQCIASSTDGRNFTKFDGNPVLNQITAGNRDPKVIWHEPTRQWVMVLYVALPEHRHTVHFFTSPNLRDWTLASITEGINGNNYLYECPDFFELPLDDNPNNRKWVLLGANHEYAVGTFDGVTFHPEHNRLPGHRGRGFYAAQTFSDVPRHDGRRIQIGWFQTETKGMPFNQSMTVPLVLKLTTTPDRPRLTFTPVKELESLRTRSHNFETMTLTAATPNPVAHVQAELVELRAEFEPGPESKLIFTVRGALITYDATTQELIVNEHRAPAPLRDGRQRLTVFCDRTGLEVFANDGLTYVPMPFIPRPDDLTLGLAAKGGPVNLTALQLHELKSAWTPNSPRSETHPDWNQFRGPNGAGVASAFKPPIKIAPPDAAWTTPVPPGNSSPVLHRNRIFLTGIESNRLVTLALDATSGTTLWKQQAPKTELERVHQAASAAASTPCADEDRVYVYFGSYGLLCYDHDGRELWKKPIPTPKNMYGVATSPILHQNLLILALDDDADLPGSPLSRSRVIALDRLTGEPVWQTSRPYNRGTWTTPMIWNHEHGTDLVLLGNGRVYGYDPSTGMEKWYVNGFAREPIAVPVAGDGQLYVSVSMQGGRGDVHLDPEPFWAAMLQFDRNNDQQIGRDEINERFTLPFRPELSPDHPGFGLPLPHEPVSRKHRQIEVFNWLDKNKDGSLTRQEFTADMSVGHGRPNLMAIRPGGSGDLTESHVNWNLRSGIPEIPSPIHHDGRLYMVRDGGILSCVKTDSGEVVYRERLGATGQYMASPVIANDHLYLVSTRGIVTIVKIGDRFEIVHQAALKASVAATPALDPNSLYVRAGDALMAFR